MYIEFELNGEMVAVDVEPDTPLLWIIRDTVGLKGTKFGCGIGLCGACTLLVDGEVVRSCSTQVGAVGGKRLTTIEGVDPAHVVKQAWIAHQVPQCGYCQSGQIMAAVHLLSGNASPSDVDIDDALSGNLCRCGTYPKIRAAIHDAASRLGEAQE